MVGSVVGNYKIIDKIGEGGMGAVFKGVDLMLEREVAIKMLRPELARQPNVVERFRTEAVTLAKLNHPNVATLHSFFRQGEDFFMVMEYVRGETLDDVIRKNGAMPCDQAVEMFCMALEGIDHAHKMGIVHRDIKPANMMLTETGSIKVMDFGIARVLGTDRLTKAGHLIGTVEYMSPEQVRGEETDARSDIYSLGMLLYEMLTGRVPFNSTSEYELMRCQIEDAPAPPRTIAPHIPLAVEQAIMRSLAKKREARYQSASEFRKMLMQRNTGAITTPLEAPRVNTGGYAAPATRIGSPTATPSSGETVKATRLAGDQGFAPAAGGIKETRLGQPGAVAYQQNAQATYAQPQGAAPGVPAQASFFSNLNWKHFAAAGTALVAVLAVAVALIAGGGTKPAAPEAPPASSQPSATAPPSPPVPAPAQDAQPTQAQPVNVPPPVTPGAFDPQPAPSNPNPSRSRDARAPKTSDAPPAVVAQPVPQQPSHPQTTQPPATKPDKVAATKPETKEPAKAEEKKDEKKKGGIGGFFKKVFGSDKKKDEKKDEKKP
jgi:tRNA A-37 threonylcarbamoyl transferase component Bud32